jgi:hypothetical protein
LDGDHYKSKTFTTFTTTLATFTIDILQIESVATQPTFEEFRLVKLQVPSNRPKFAEGFPFEL